MSGMIIRRTAVGIALALILGTAAHARPLARVDSRGTEPAGITGSLLGLWNELLLWLAPVAPTGRGGLTALRAREGSQMDPDGALALKVPRQFVPPPSKYLNP